MGQSDAISTLRSDSSSQTLVTPNLRHLVLRFECQTSVEKKGEKNVSFVPEGKTQISQWKQRRQKKNKETKGRKSSSNERNKIEERKSKRNKKFQVLFFRLLPVLLSIICQSLQYSPSRGQIQSYDLYIIILTYVYMYIIHVRFQSALRAENRHFVGRKGVRAGTFTLKNKSPRSKISLKQNKMVLSSPTEKKDTCLALITLRSPSIFHFETYSSHILLFHMLYSTIIITQNTRLHVYMSRTK